MSKVVVKYSAEEFDVSFERDIFLAIASFERIGDGIKQRIAVNTEGTIFQTNMDAALPNIVITNANGKKATFCRDGNGLEVDVGSMKASDYVKFRINPYGGQTLDIEIVTSSSSVPVKALYNTLSYWIEKFLSRIVEE